MKESAGKTRRYLLCGLKSGCRFRTRRRTPGSYYTERCGKQTQPYSNLCGNYFTDDKAKLPTHVEIDARKYQIVKNTVVLLEQIRTIDKLRLKELVCHLDQTIMKKVDESIKLSFELHT